jgi:transcriptional regulator with XRE-family HTH domain
MLFRMVAYMERQQRQAAKTATKGKAAARGGRARRYFGGRLKAERERRNWTQVEMARRLADTGWPVNATVLAKIEAANEDARRSLKVDEALAVAEVFGMSLDSLLGRTNDAESSEELELILRTAVDTARTMANTVAGIASTFQNRFAELKTLEFTGHKQLDEAVTSARQALDVARLALDQAASELGAIAVFPLPDNDFQVSLRRMDWMNRQAPEHASDTLQQEDPR